MEQALVFPKSSSLLIDESEERNLLYWVDRLNLKKVGWDHFLQRIGDPLIASRISTSDRGRSLLHLAVLDNRLDVIQTLKRESSLKLRRDLYGLSPVDLAQLLNRKEALQLLEPLTEIPTFPDLPLLKNFEYLSHPIFETSEGLERTLAYTAKAKKDDSIPAEKIWMGIYFDKEIRKGVHPPVSIHLVDSEVGYGVFADTKIAPCSYVGEYTGVIQQRTPHQLKKKTHCLRYAIWDVKKNFAIDAEEKGNFTRFINHSEEPNLGVQAVYWRGIPRMIFVSISEIKEGSQLTFDYGPLFWKHSSQRPKEFNDD